MIYRCERITFYLVIFIFYILCSCKGRASIVQQDAVVSTNDNSLNRLLVENEALLNKLNNSYLNDSIKFENFKTGNLVGAKELFESGRHLVLQYSELDCDVCVDSALNDFQRYAKKIGVNNVVVLAAADNRRYMANFVRLNKFHLDNIYLIPLRDCKSLYVMTPGMPFLYITDDMLKLTNTFIPRKEFPALSKSYYKKIENMFIN